MNKRRFAIVAVGLVLLALVSVLVWRSRQPRPLRSASFQGRLGYPEFSPDGRTLAVPTAKGIALWDVRAWKQVGFLPGDGKSAYWASDSKSLLVFGSTFVGFGTPQNHNEGSLTWWNVKTEQTKFTIKLPGISQYGGFDALSHDLRYVVATPSTRTGVPDTVENLKIPGKVYKSSIQVWDTTRATKIVTLPTQGLWEPQFSSDDKLLVGVERRARGVERLRLWDMQTWRELHVLDGKTPDIRCARFSPDGTLLATGAKRQITLWDTATWRQVRILPAQFVDLFRLRFSADGKRLAAGGRYESRLIDGPDFFWTLWDPMTGRKIAAVHHSYGWGFRSGSNVILTEDLRKLPATTVLMDENARPIWSSVSVAMEADKEAQIVTTEALSPDERLLVTGTSLVFGFDTPTASDRNRGLLQLWNLR